MRSGAASLYMLEVLEAPTPCRPHASPSDAPVVSDRQGYTYCPSDPGSCAGSSVSAYFPQLDLARQYGFINHTVIALGWMLGKSALNPGGWTAGSLRAAMTTLKQRYPESELRSSWFALRPPDRPGCLASARDDDIWLAPRQRP